MTTQATPGQTTRTMDIERLRNALGFTATFSAWGNRCKADIGKVETEAEKSRLKLSKELIKAEEYDRIKSYLGEVRTWIYCHTVPSFFKEGFQLVSSTEEAINAVENRMRQAQTDLDQLVAALVAVYPGKVDAARVALADQFNANDYPTADELARMFSIGWNWIAFTVPEGLPAALRQQETEKLQRQFEDAGQQITDALRVAFQELISHATEKLTVAPGERPKIFRDSLIGNIQEFINTFSGRNLMNDTDLAALVERARGVLVGVEPEKLRKYASTREGIRAQFAEIQTALDGMITERRGRKFDLSPD